MPLRSNLNDVTREVKRLAGCLNMRAKGRKKSIGLDAAEIIVKGVRERTVDRQQGAGGAPLAPLAPSTLKEKSRRGYPSTIGVRTGEMLSPEELGGETVVTRTAVDIEYGQSEDVKARMDRFTGGGPKQPARPFFELDPKIEADLDRLVDDVIDRNI